MHQFISRSVRGKAVNVDVDQLLLDRQLREIRSPAPQYRPSDIHVIQIGMPVVAFPGFDH